MFENVAFQIIMR